MATQEQKTVLPKGIGKMKEIGNSGTEIYGGYLFEEYNQTLQGHAGLEIYEKMRRSDATVNATLLACEMPIRSTKWFIEPATDGTGEEVADFVSKALFENMEQSWDDYLREVLTMFAFGFSLFEKVYKFEDNRIWIKKLGLRKQETIEKWETMDGKEGVVQNINNDLSSIAKQVSIPADKLLLFTYRREGDNYEGVSTLRTSYKNRFFKNKFLNYDAINQERRSMGIPVTYLPDGASDKEKKAMEKIVENIRGGATTGITLPGSKEKGWLFEYADLGDGTKTAIHDSIKYHDTAIAANMLAEFTKMGADGNSGNRSLGETKTEMFMLAMDATARNIKEIINRNLIKELVDLNFDVEEYPKLNYDTLKKIDVALISNSLGVLSEKGLLVPDDDLEVHLREKLDLPPKSEDAPPRIPEEPKEKKEEPKVKKKPGKEKVKEEEKEDKEMMEFQEITGMINNKFIVKLQNEIRSPEDRAILKKKGFKLNEYEGKAPRPLTFAERKVNFTSIKRSLDSFENILSEKVREITEKQKNDLLKQVDKAVRNNDIKAIGAIKVRYKGELSQAITDVQKEMFEIGKKTASTEMLVPVPPTKQEVKGAMRVQNDVMVNGLAGRMENEAKTEATNVINAKGGISNTTSAEATGAVNATLTKTISRIGATANTVGVSGSLNLGRTTIFEKYPEKIYGFQYSAILDSATTDYCRSLDGRVVGAGSPEFYQYNPPKHFNCRSLWIEILNEETFKPPITGITKSITPPKSLNDFSDIKKPIILRGSPAIASIKRELDERKRKLAKLRESGLYLNQQKDHEKRIKQLESSLVGKFTEYILQKI